MNVIKVRCYDGSSLLIDDSLVSHVYSVGGTNKVILSLKDGSSLPLDMSMEEWVDCLFSPVLLCCPEIKNSKDYVRYVELS